MAISTIPVFTGTSPDRNTQSAAAFTLNSIEWLDYQLVQIDATNVSIEGINLAVIDINDDVIAAASSAADSASSASDSAASAVTSQSNANFKGRWSDATGAATVPATYSNNSQTWQLLQDIPDITADEPLPGAVNWLVVNEINMANVNVSKLDNPLLHLYAKNDLVRVINEPATALSSIRNTTATFVDINGVVRTADVDDPREEASGWLFEGGGDNLLIRTEDINDAIWVVGGTASKGASTDDPKQGNSGITIALPAVNDAIEQSISISAGTEAYTQSLDIRGNAGDTVSLQILDNTATILSIKQITLAANYVREEVSVSNDGAQTDVRFEIRRRSGDTATSIDIALPQLEKSPFATSYQESIAVAEPRSADNQSIPVEGNFRMSEGSIFMKADVIGDTGSNQQILHISDGVGPNRIEIVRSNDKIRLIIVSGGVTQVDMSTTFNMNVGVQYEIAINYKDNDVELFVDGVSAGKDTSSAMPEGLTTINIGRSLSGSELFGHIQSLQLWKSQNTLDEIKYLGGQ